MDAFNVLLVDDEIDFLETLIKRLRKRGLSVSAARSGSEALGFLQKQPVDVVVLDVRMPGMDGIATLKQIKRDWPLVEVVMLTGHASVEAAIQGMELGAFDYMMKPMDIDELYFKLQDAYQKKSLQEKKIHRFEELRR